MAANNAVACIGWGSLVWDPRDLPMRGTWHNDGPLLPVEFVRESGAKGNSRGDRITLVIHEGAPRVRTYWALLDTPDLETARRRLARREGIPNRWDTDIGFVDLVTSETKGNEAEAIAAWVSRMGLAAAVWTNLPCKFDGKDDPPAVESVIAFLDGLEGDKRAGAEGYVRQAPAQIDTPYRREIERRLGWTRRS